MRVTAWPHHPNPCQLARAAGQELAALGDRATPLRSCRSLRQRRQDSDERLSTVMQSFHALFDLVHEGEAPCSPHRAWYVPLTHTAFQPPGCEHPFWYRRHAMQTVMLQGIANDAGLAGDVLLICTAPGCRDTTYGGHCRAYRNWVQAVASCLADAEVDSPASPAHRRLVRLVGAAQQLRTLMAGCEDQKWLLQRMRCSNLALGCNDEDEEEGLWLPACFGGAVFDRGDASWGRAAPDSRDWMRVVRVLQLTPQQRGSLHRARSAAACCALVNHIAQATQQPLQVDALGLLAFPEGHISWCTAGF